MEDETVPTRLRETLRTPDVETHPCLIVLAGVEVGRVYRLDKQSTVVGRVAQADIRLPAEGVSRKHAEVRVVDGEMVLVDLGSTNGVWVEGRRVSEHTLREGERIQLGAATILQFSLRFAEQHQIQEQLYESATRDPLTSAFNRRVFDEYLAREISHARRHALRVSLLLLDIDHFKSINDTHGHPAGDQVLRELGALISDSIRAEDLFCRVGGEEFAVVTRDPGAEGPAHFAERLRHLVQRHELAVDTKRLHVTISIGVATYGAEYPTPEALYGAADEALYDAKHSGRNCVRVAQ